jgi:hypothetical protein
MAACLALTLGGSGGSFASAIQNFASTVWVINGAASAATGAREVGEVDWGELTLVFMTFREHHLLPANLAE